MSQTPSSSGPLDLVGKRIVYISDPYPHGNGLIPRHAWINEVVVDEPDYTAIQRLGDLDGIRSDDGYRPIMPVWFELAELEPGDRLERYLPGASAVFGSVDYIYFRGKAREKWDREHATPTGS